jgi:hypothetical protein
LHLSHALDIAVDELLFGHVDTERIAYSIAVPQHRKGNRHGHGPDAGSAAEALRERAEAFLRTYDFQHRLSIGDMARQLGCSAQKLGYLMPNLRYRLVEQYVHVACEPFKKDTANGIVAQTSVDFLNGQRTDVKRRIPNDPPNGRPGAGEPALRLDQQIGVRHAIVAVGWMERETDD